MMSQLPRGRPKKFAQYEKLLTSLPKRMAKRPRYVDGVGVFRGVNVDTAWIKIHLPRGATHKGKTHKPGSSLEIKLGRLSSWTWEQLEHAHREMQGKADRGEPFEDAPIVTFEAWASDWMSRARVRLKGFATARIHLEQQFLPKFGAVLLSEIQTRQINQWMAKRLQHAAPATVKRELATLNVILNDAVRAGHIDSNPGRRADPIRGVVGRQRFLDGEEILRLLAAAQKTAPWLPDLILWAIHSGMRKGEIKALLWSDIRAIPNRRSIVQISTSKSGQPRMITCTATMEEILERQKVRQMDGNDRVFPISAMTLRRKWEKARKEAGLEDVTVHDLRRTHSTHSAAAGVDLRTLADRIGHTDLTMLQKHYAAVVGDAAVEAAETFQKAFDRMTGAGHGRAGAK